MKFIVNPDLREILWGSCDIPTDFSQVLRDFKNSFPNLDTRLMQKYNNKKYWYIYDLQNEMKSHLINRIQEDASYNPNEYLLDTIGNVYPNKVESSFNVY